MLNHYPSCVVSCWDLCERRERRSNVLGFSPKGLHTGHVFNGDATFRPKPAKALQIGLNVDGEISYLELVISCILKRLPGHFMQDQTLVERVCSPGHAMASQTSYSTCSTCAIYSRSSSREARIRVPFFL